MAEPSELVAFYEAAYSQAPSRALRYSRWRALGAIGKADHVVRLCGQAALRPASTLEVGCGDGALLSELHRRGFGGRLSGVEISESAVAIAAQREELASVRLYDGKHLDVRDASYDLGVLSHVLEHVEDPAALLREVARACRAVLLEVPLEANLSARRASKRAHQVEVGHLQRFDRKAIRGIVASAGLSILCELEDPLPLSVHRFFKRTLLARSAATAKWSVRTLLHRLAPAVARATFTVHYACLARDDSSAGAARHAGQDHPQP
jgi:2-polyprenyl-3-methyl-5-hydroxy-6-metoxy-1,4-benzoquinol methylase